MTNNDCTRRGLPVSYLLALVAPRLLVGLRVIAGPLGPASAETGARIIHTLLE